MPGEGRNISGRLRGVLTLVVSGFVFVGLDLIQRTLIVAIIKVWPRSRERVLSGWVKRVYSTILWVPTHVGGAKMEILAAIPAEAGVLVLMNHQSLLDIPIAFACMTGGYPKVVTRERYRKGYPVVSHMVRLYGHPTVRPGEHAAIQLEALRRMAAAADRPVVIYPEGSRARDGKIRPFKTAGLKAMLSARPWSVYVLVADGLWKTAGLKGFVKHMTSTRVRVESVGPFGFDATKDDADRFIASMELRMTEKLAEMRALEKEE
jgi:1-acyl-sn-glycerol-3-phosphate acyltransferase